MRPEGLCELKIAMTPSRIEPATFRLWAQFLKLTAPPRAPVSTGGQLIFFVADFFHKTENKSLFSSFPCVDCEKKHSAGPSNRSATYRTQVFDNKSCWYQPSISATPRMTWNLLCCIWLHVLYSLNMIFIVHLYRVIHKCRLDFRTGLRNNQDRHGRKEHINR